MRRVIYCRGLSEGGGEGYLQELTVRERIQLHLFDWNRFAEAYAAPLAVTQSGIARAVGIRVHHVTQYVKPLIAEGLVEEGVRHIEKKPRRRKVYFLTGKGRANVATLRESLLRDEVPFRRADGTAERVTLNQVHQEHRRGDTILALVREVADRGFVAESPRAAPGGLVDFSQEAPQVERFYGREAELGAVLEAVASAPLVVVTGMAGMGKTTLASKACEALRGNRSLFWRQLRPWDTALDLASRLGAFLAALGRKGVHGSLMGPGPADLGRIEDLLRADLSGIGALLVFDDVQEASEDARQFLALLLRVLRTKPGPSALFLSREAPTVYSRRDVDVDRVVAEYPLPGLDQESGMSLLADAGVDPRFRKGLASQCGGSPLFLRLVASRGAATSAEEGWSTVESYIAEEIEPALAGPDRACLELASFYAIPVPSAGLLLEEPVRGGTLAGLQAGGLLIPTGGGKFAIHDSVRTHFQQGIAYTRRAALSALAVDWLAREAEAQATAGNLQESTALLGNAVAVETDSEGRHRHLERLGDIRRLTGDLEASEEAYRTVLAEAPEPEAKARLYQKIAGILLARGRLEEADRAVEAGLGFLPAQPSLEAGWLLFRRALAAYSREAYDSALEDLATIAAWLPALGADPDLLGSVTNLRGLVFVSDPHRRDPSLALQDFRSAVEAYEVAGDRRGECMAYNNMGYAALTMGDADRAFGFLDRGMALARATGDLPAQQTLLFTKAYGLTDHVGDYEAAEALWQESYRLAKSTHQLPKVVWHYWHFANLYQRQGRYEEARESIRYFLSRSGNMLGTESRAVELCTLARLSVACDDVGSAASELAEAREVAGDPPSRYAQHFIKRAEAAVKAARGDAAGARASYEKARELAPEERGEFLLEYGRFLSEWGTPSEARELLLEAEETLRREGMVPLARASTEALRRLSRPGKEALLPTRRPPS